MRVLIADDDLVTAARLKGLLRSWHYEVTAVANGADALDVLEREPVDLCLLDWMMPELSGLEVCRRVRAVERHVPVYLILLTGRDSAADVVTGLQAGADDYLSKPFDTAELGARLRAGARIVKLQQESTAQVKELETTLANVHRLEGLLPFCSSCKCVRDDSDYWHRVDHYVSDHSEAEFTHGVCPTCFEKVVKLWGLDETTRDTPA